MTERKEVIIEDASLIFRNFAGAPDKFNAMGGKRSFHVILDPDVAEQMLEDGWNVKYLKPREDDEDQVETPYIKVNVNFNGPRPPRIVMISSMARTNIGEDLADTLDQVNIREADLIFTSFEYDVNGSTGISAYLKSLYVTIEEDYLEKKYAVAVEDEYGPEDEEA